MSDEEMGVVIRRDFGGLAQVKESDRASIQRCRHTSTIVDEDARTVACATCGAALDAIQVLLEYATNERHWRGWESEVNRCHRELAALKAEERKVKARTRAASRKDAGEAVRAEQIRTEKARLDTIQAARDVASLARRIEQMNTRKAGK